MSDENRQQLKDIFDAALQQKPEQRQAFIHEKCGGDETLRFEVESLLTSFDEAGSFMQETAIAEVADVIVEKNNSEKGRIFGHYEIIKQIGVGGMGEVYLAQDTKLGRLVALKILNENFNQHDSNRSRFIQEAKAASLLNHPNILVIHEIGEADNVHFIVSEYIEGKTLRQIIPDLTFNYSQILDISIQVANALATAHEAHLVHRDIKPENIMVRPDGLVKILDFGLAKFIEQKKSISGLTDEITLRNETAQGIILGTVKYMSPEQAKGEKIDERTDIFSFGAVIYEMVAGKTPFGCESVTETWTKLLHLEPEPLSCFVPDIPDELERVIAKMLRKNAGERYQKVKDLLTDLKDLRETLAFGARLEKSQPPVTKNETDKLQKTDQNTNFQTVETNYSPARQIKRPRLFSALALIFLIGAIGFGYWFFANYPANTKQIESIAVIPFVNESNNPEVEYLSDGMTETLISSLSQLPKLSVKARSSAFRYKGKETDAKTIGKELNVQKILTGRLVQQGNNLMLYITLIDTATEKVLWKSDYNRSMKNLVNLQNDVARDVSNRLQLKLSGQDEQRLTRNYTENVEAYKFYLKGRFYWNKRTTADLKKAIEQFQQALDNDKYYALGYVGMADCFVLLQEYADIPADETLFNARIAIDRALKLDDSLVEAHASSGYIYLTEWHWYKAEEEFKRAIELNPNYPIARHWFALYYMIKRQFDDALREARRAQELDPLSPVINGNIALIYLLKNDPDSAIEECLKIIEFDPDNVLFAREYLGLAYIKKRDYDKAAEVYEKAVALSNRGGRELSALGYLYAVMGKRAEAMKILKELEDRNIGQRAFWVYAGLGDKDLVFVELEKQFQKHSRGLRHITYNLFLEDIHSDPRFDEMVHRLGLEL